MISPLVYDNCLLIQKEKFLKKRSDNFKNNLDKKITLIDVATLPSVIKIPSPRFPKILNCGIKTWK